MVSKKAKSEITLSAKKREIKDLKPEKLRKQGFLPGVIYGHKIKNMNIFFLLKDFLQTYQKAGENSLIDLSIEGQKTNLSVLIYDVQKDPISGDIVHVDLYKPNLEKTVEAAIPLTIKGTAPAVKSLGGTLVKHFYELEVRAFPMNLPHEILVDVNSLEQIGNEILIKDLKVEEGVEILHDPEEIVIMVAPPENVEKELEKPIEEKLEEIETVKPKEEEVEEEGEEKAQKKEEAK